jgi:hypothetical protein
VDVTFDEVVTVLKTYAGFKGQLLEHDEKREPSNGDTQETK